MGEVVKIALIVLAVSLTVIFTCDMIFHRWFERKKEFIADLCLSTAKALELIRNSQKEQAS